MTFNLAEHSTGKPFNLTELSAFDPAELSNWMTVNLTEHSVLIIYLAEFSTWWLFNLAELSNGLLLT